MKMTLDSMVDVNTISAYEAGLCTIHGESFQPSIIVFPERIIADWSVPSIQHLAAQDFDPIIAEAPAVLLLGTGEVQRFPGLSIVQPLVDAQIGYEVMHNRSACQTYNILLGEGRRVALALLAG